MVKLNNKLHLELKNDLIVTSPKNYFLNKNKMIPRKKYVK